MDKTPCGLSAGEGWTLYSTCFLWSHSTCFQQQAPKFSRGTSPSGFSISICSECPLAPCCHAFHLEGRGLCMIFRCHNPLCLAGCCLQTSWPACQPVSAWCSEPRSCWHAHQHRARKPGTSTSFSFSLDRNTYSITLGWLWRFWRLCAPKAFLAHRVFSVGCSFSDTDISSSKKRCMTILGVFPNYADAKQSAL